MRITKLLMTSCAALVLAGCATAPTQPPGDPETAPPLQWQAPLPHNGTPTDLSRWWQDLGDPLLVELQDAAQKASPTLASARARLAQSRAALRQAQAGAGPTVDGSASAGRSSTQIGSFPTTALMLGVQASWEIDVFGANRLARDAARARLDSAQALWHDARVMVAAELAGRYFGQRACVQRHLITLADARSRQETARLSELTQRAGFTASATTALARAAASEANGRAIRQDAECAQGIKTLVALTGMDEADLVRRLAHAPMDLAPLARLTVSALPAETLAQRPDIVAAERDIVAASAEAGGAQARRYPRLGLSGSIGGLHYRTAGTSGDMATWSIGPLALSLPLFDGGRREADIDAARARYTEAVALYQARVRLAVREVEQALVALRGTQDGLVDATIAEAGYRDWQQATEARYSAGLASLVELEDARRTRLAAADGLVALRRDRIQAWIDLYRAAGGGWSSASAATHPP